MTREPSRGARRLAAWATAIAIVMAGCSGSSSPRDEGGRNPLAQSPAPRVVQSLFPRIPNDATRAPGGWFESACALRLSYMERMRRGHYPGRSPEVLMVPREPNFVGSFAAHLTTHSGPWDYLQRVPLVFYGPGFVASRGEISYDREVTLADVAPTLAELLRVPFPKKRPGRQLDGVLLPPSQRPGVPKLVLTVVWDGGGWDVLRTWPDAWPYLEQLAAEGASVADVIVGSSPSVTPAVHATMGTGTFPNEHGVTNIPVRLSQRKVGGALLRGEPDLLEVPTLADLYDPLTGNAAKIGFFAYRFFHLGMMGQGAFLPGGDKDLVVVAEKEPGPKVTGPGVMSTNPSYYYMPDYVDDVPGFGRDLRQTDLDDGKLDDRWMGHVDLTQPNNVRHSPVWVLYQTRLIKALMTREGFGDDEIADLFFVNYKEIDDVGHNWNMLFPEMREILEYSDDALRDLTAFLDAEVGERQWVVVVTADHGQAPEAAEIGAWPIEMTELRADVTAAFGADPEKLIQDSQATGLFLDTRLMRRLGITRADVADFLVDYRIEDNVLGDAEVPRQYRDRARELLFEAAWPSDATEEVWRCATSRGA